MEALKEIKDKEITLVLEGKEVTMFAVTPKRDCPHLQKSMKESLDHLLIERKELVLSNACEECGDKSENWFCLECSKVLCSRMVNEHMAQHNLSTSHVIAFSFYDASFWCYKCDSYITTQDLEVWQRRFSKTKFPPKVNEIKEVEEPEETENKKEEAEEKKVEEEKKVDNHESKPSEDEKKLEEAFSSLKVSEEQADTESFTYKSLLEGIKSKKYRNIAFLTGAGISVSAGIPDFRTPGTGLYSKLQQYNLPYPEAVFELGYFKKNPQAFYTVSQGFLTSKIKPTTSHFFQKMIYDMGLLGHIFTQNIDGLELEAGIPLEKLCQAHGHMRSCHCVKCRKEKDNKRMIECLEKAEIYKCECDGLVKPDIIFFGERLPVQFFQDSSKLRQMDLIIVMGTSLLVFPFANLVSLIAKEVPIVLINREKSMVKDEENFLFLSGDIDENVNKIVKDLGMEIEFEKIKKEALSKYEGKL